MIWLLAALAGCTGTAPHDSDSASTLPLPCGDGVCSEADDEDTQTCPWDCGFTTLVLSDLGRSNDGGTPGVDLDAVSLEQGGETLWVTEVVDAVIQGPDNAWTDVTQALGPSDSDCQTKGFVSLGGHDAWIALSFGVPIRAGDTLTVYELSDRMCSNGASNDPWELLLSDTATPLDGQWIGASYGKDSVEVPAF